VLQQAFLRSQVGRVAGNGPEGRGFVSQLGVGVGPVAADEALLQQAAELVFELGGGQPGFLEQRAKRGDEVQLVEQVEVPTETVTEVKRGKKVQVERKFMPGYVLAKLGLNDDVALVTRDQLAALRAELEDVLQRYRRVGQGNPQAKRVAVYTYAYPVDLDQTPGGDRS